MRQNFFRKFSDLIVETEQEVRTDASEITKSVEESYNLSKVSEYESSTDFESDVYELNNSLLKAKKVAMSKKWKNWMRSTDMNYGTEGQASELSNELERKL